MGNLVRRRGKRSRRPLGRHLTSAELKTLARALKCWTSRDALQEQLRALLTVDQFKRLGSALALCRQLAAHKQAGVDVIRVPRGRRERLQNVLNVTLQAIDTLTGQCGISTWTFKGRVSAPFKQLAVYWVAGHEPAERLSRSALLERLVPRRPTSVGPRTALAPPANDHSVKLADPYLPWYAGQVERDKNRGTQGEEQAADGETESLSAGLRDGVIELSVPEPESRALLVGLTALGELKRNPSERRAEDVARALLECYPPLDDRVNWFRRRHLLKVAEFSSELIAEYRLTSATAAQLIYRAGVAAESLGDADAAKRYLQTATALCKRNGLWPLLSWALTRLSDANYTLGDHAAAQQAARRVLRIRRKLGANPELLARAYGEVGTTMIDTSIATLGPRSIRNAITYFEKAKALWQEEVARGNTSQYAWCLYSLAMSHLLLGDLPRSRETLEPALRLKQSEVGKDHPVMAFLKAAEARLFRAEGDLHGAVTLADEALDLWTNGFEDRHPVVVRLLLLKTELAREDGRRRDALATLERADAARSLLVPGNLGVDGLVKRARSRLDS